MSDTDTPKSWYKQFWPWFLIALPLTAVIGSMITINIAFTDADGLVKDDYYKEGLAMNRDIARKQNAENLGIEAQGNIDVSNETVSFLLNDAAIGNVNELSLSMIHPTRADNDMIIALNESTPKTFTGKLSQKINPGYWWVRITPPSNAWYIEGRIRLPQDQTLTLK
jgi:hypothetical protein